MEILPLIAVFGLMYFLLVRPQKKRMQEQRRLIESVGEGAEIMTTSGIYGFVTAVETDLVWVEIADNVQIRVAKAAIAKIVESAPAASTDSSTADNGDSSTETDSGDK